MKPIHKKDPRTDRDLFLRPQAFASTQLVEIYTTTTKPRKPEKSIFKKLATGHLCQNFNTVIIDSG